MYRPQPYFGISNAEVDVSIVCFFIIVFQLFLDFVSFVIFDLFFDSLDVARNEVSVAWWEYSSSNDFVWFSLVIIVS